MQVLPCLGSKQPKSNPANTEVRVFGGSGAKSLVFFQKAGSLLGIFLTISNIYQRIKLKWFILSSFCDVNYTQDIEHAKYMLELELQTT